MDYDANGTAIGIELTAPGLASAEQLNDVMKRLGHEPLLSQELAPLEAA